jgi:hypothetical protein
MKPRHVQHICMRCIECPYRMVADCGQGAHINHAREAHVDAQGIGEDDCHVGWHGRNRHRSGLGSPWHHDHGRQCRYKRSEVYILGRSMRAGGTYHKRLQSPACDARAEGRHGCGSADFCQFIEPDPRGRDEREGIHCHILTSSPCKFQRGSGEL